MSNGFPEKQKYVRFSNVVKSVLYIFYSTLLLFPLLSTPVVSDDFAAPFYQFQRIGFGATAAIKYGWDNAYGGVNFRILGMPFGSLIHFLYVDMAGRFGIRMSTSYFMTKLVIFLGVGITAFWVCRELLILAGKRISNWTILFVSSTVFFVTLQNHAMWSNDPVASYPLAGFGSVILGLAVLATALSTVRRGLSAQRLISLTLLTTAAVLYYELNVGIVLGIAPLLVMAACTPKIGSPLISTRTRLLRLVQVSVPCVVPAIALVFGRMLSGSSAQTYGGTTIRLGRRSLETFRDGLISTLPGSSWNLSREQLGGSIGLLLWMVPITLVLIFVLVSSLTSQHVQIQQPATTRNLVVGAAIFALTSYWFVGVGIQSVTVKVQDESLRIGYVYTYYAIGATVVAIMLTLVVLFFFSTLGTKSSTVMALSAASVFSFVQLTVNWRIMEKMNESLVPNRELLVAFSSQADVPHRCRALLDWSNGPWPDYYEEGMIGGLQAAYRHYHDEDFCPNFERPKP